MRMGHRTCSVSQIINTHMPCYIGRMISKLPPLNMDRTNLVQRLRNPKDIVANTFSFGGGLIYGGLSEKAFDNFTKIWTFDYMGAAEFEWGFIPKALQKIAGYYSEDKIVTKKIVLTKDVYYLCERNIEGQVRDIIKKLSQDEYNDLRLKEPCFLDAYLKGECFAQNIGGWLELNNAFMFFVDKIMYQKTLELFWHSIYEPNFNVSP